MSYFKVQSTKNAFCFFVVPFLLFAFLGFVDKPPYIVFNYYIFLLIFAGLFLMQAAYNYVSHRQQKEGKELSRFGLLIPSLTVLFLYFITIYIQTMHPLDANTEGSDSIFSSKVTGVEKKWGILAKIS